MRRKALNSRNNKKKPNVQEGAGFADIFNQVYSKSINLLPSSDDTARPSFPGERHAILQLPNGLPGVANFVGPGTQVIKRLERGDQGRTPTDMVAKRHDIDFTLAQSAPDKKTQLELTRKADQRMISSLKKIQKGAHGGDRIINVQPALRGIQSKIALEDAGLMDKSKFAGDLKTFSASDKQLLEKNRDLLEQQGYGSVEYLRQSVLKKLEQDKKKVAKTMAKAPAIIEWVIKIELPKLEKMLDVKIPISKVAPLLGSAIKSASGKSDSVMLKALGSVLLPLIINAKLKQQKIKPDPDSIMKIKDRLESKFHTEFKKAYDKKFKNVKSQSGGGLWKSFKKLATDIFKPGSKILANILTSTGNPEIGVPLAVVSDLV